MKLSSKNLKVLIIFGVILTATNLRAPLTDVPPILDFIIAQFNLSPTQAGLIITIPLILFSILSPLAPKISFLFGIEKTIFVSLVILTFGILFRSINQLYFFYFGISLIGIGIAISNVLVPALIKKYIPNMIPLITAFYTLSMGVFAAISSSISIPVLNWINTYNSVYSTGTLISIIILPLISIVFWIICLRFCYNDTNKHASLKHKTNSLRILKSTLAWNLSFYIGVNSFLTYSIMMWLPLILNDIGYSKVNAGFIHGIFILMTSIPSIVMLPFLSKVNLHKFFALSSGVLIFIGFLGLQFMPSFAIFWSIVLGFGTGVGFLLALTFMGLRGKNSEVTSILSAKSQTFGYALAAIGPILIGHLHDHFNNWMEPNILCMFLAISLMLTGWFASQNKVIE